MTTECSDYNRDTDTNSEDDDDVIGRRTAASKEAKINSESSENDSDEDSQTPPRRKRRSSAREADDSPLKMTRQMRSFFKSGECGSAKDEGLMGDDSDSSFDEFINDNEDDEEASSNSDDQSERAAENAGTEENDGTEKSGGMEQNDTTEKDEGVRENEDATVAIQSNTRDSIENSAESQSIPDDQCNDEDDDGVTPNKRRKSGNQISSDESDVENQGEEGKENSDSDVEEVKVKHKKKRRRRILQVPDSQDTKESDSEEKSASDTESNISSESNGLSDFIASDSEPLSGDDEDNSKRNYPEEERDLIGHISMKHRDAFRVIIEMLISVVFDKDFLTSRQFTTDNLFESAIKKILDPLDALARDLCSQAWHQGFKDALNRTEYSSHFGAKKMFCEACNKSGRYSSQTVKLSGHTYNRQSLQDDCLDKDSMIDAVRFNVGRDCEKRAQLYHEALHFRKSLLDGIRSKIVRNGLLSGTVENAAMTLLADMEWIELQYRHYKSLMDNSQIVIRKRSKNPNYRDDLSL